MNKKDTLTILGFIIVFVLGMAALQFIKTVDLVTQDTLEEIKYNASLVGYNTAIYNIFSEVSKCQQVLPIEFNNQTINLVAVECLNLNNNNGGTK